MNLFLPDPLTREEMSALKLIATAPPLRGLPYKVQKRLVDLGFAETVRGGLIATEDGLLRIKIGMNENLRDWQTPVLAASVREQLTNHSAHRGLPFFGIVYCLGQLGDVERGVAQGRQLFALGSRIGPLNSRSQPMS
jgi:hypothetical protein